MFTSINSNKSLTTAAPFQTSKLHKLKKTAKPIWEIWKPILIKFRCLIPCQSINTTAQVMIATYQSLITIYIPEVTMGAWFHACSAQILM